MKYEIVWAYNPEDGEKPEDGYLDYKGESLYSEAPVTPADVTLEQLAEMCDNNAENRNNHAYVGAHRMLAAIIHRTIGRAEATRVMWEIASYGGLDYASGCGADDNESAWKDFGIEDCWKDWKLIDDTNSKPPVG